MTTIANLVKLENFEEAVLRGHFLFQEKSFIEEFNNLKIKNKEIFRLRESEDKFYTLIIALYNEKFDDESFEICSNFFEEKLAKIKITYDNKIVFHFPNTKYVADPALPIILDENKDKVGVIQLNGVRVTFPNNKLIDSLILDVMPCKHCAGDALFGQLFTKEKGNYSTAYVAEVISKAEAFLKCFIKERKNA